MRSHALTPLNKMVSLKGSINIYEVLLMLSFLNLNSPKDVGLMLYLMQFSSFINYLLEFYTTNVLLICCIIKTLITLISKLFVA